MHAEVISIGDELTSGQRLDTNSQWLSERLGELGVPVMYHTTVADDLEANIAVFRLACERADIIVASGGLGPTRDDLTREAVAAATGRELVLDEPSLEHIRRIFAFLQREMPERNRAQAYFPEGSAPIPNPNGTAPGIELAHPRGDRSPALLFALPGVPAEMFQMWQDTVAPHIRQAIGATQVIRHRRIKVFGAGESHVEQQLPDLIRRGRQPSVGITVSGATITLRITAQGPDADACAALIQPTADTIYQCLGELVYGEEDDELQHVVGRLLRQRNQTLAVAEWGSAGLVSSWLAEVEDARGHFLGGYVVADNAAAQRLFGIEQHPVGNNPVGGDPTHGEALVRQMAENCRKQLQADFALAVGPLPPLPTGGLTEKTTEAGRLHVALAGPDGTIARSVAHGGHPSIHSLRTAKVGLNLVRLALVRAGK